MITFAILAAIYMVGAILTYASNGWFEWTEEEEANQVYSIFWPLLVWFIIGFCLRRSLRRARRKAKE